MSQNQNRNTNYVDIIIYNIAELSFLLAKPLVFIRKEYALQIINQYYKSLQQLTDKLPEDCSDNVSRAITILANLFGSSLGRFKASEKSVAVHSFLFYLTFTSCTYYIPRLSSVLKLPLIFIIGGVLQGRMDCFVQQDLDSSNNKRVAGVLIGAFNGALCYVLNSVLISLISRSCCAAAGHLVGNTINAMIISNIMSPLQKLAGNVCNAQGIAKDLSARCSLFSAIAALSFVSSAILCFYSFYTKQGLDTQIVVMNFVITLFSGLQVMEHSKVMRSQNA